MQQLVSLNTLNSWLSLQVKQRFASSIKSWEEEPKSFAHLHQEPSW